MNSDDRVSLSEAITLHDAGNLLGAEKMYQDILRKTPQHPEASFHLGRLALQRGKPESAIDLMKTAWEAFPGEEQVAVVLLTCLVELGRLTEAQQFAGSSYARFGFRSEGFEALTELAVEMAEGRLPPLIQVRNCYQKFSMQQFGELVDDLECVLRDWPQWAEGWAILGAAISLNIDFSSLIAEYAKHGRHLLDSQPDSPGLEFTRKYRSELEIARDHLTHALRVDPQNAFAKQHLVRVQFEHGDALGTILSILDRTPGHSANIRECAIVSINRYCLDQGFYIRKVSERSAISIEAPPFIGAQFDCNPAMGTTWSSDVYCATLADAVVVANHDLILIGTDLAVHDKLSHPLGIVVDSSFESGIVAHEGPRLLVDSSKFRIDRAVDSAVAMTGLSSFNFGHWMFEHLPRLRALEQHDLFGKSPIYVDSKMPAAHLESLQLLVGKDHPIVEIDSGSAVRAKHLIVATSSIFFPLVCKTNTPANVHCAPVRGEDMKFIRARVLEALGLDPSLKTDRAGRRIFLRRDADSRRLLNQEEIERLLVSQHGFEVVKPEALSFSEQVKLFYAADIVFGPHSSAFCNLAFCPVGARASCLVQTYAANFPAWSHAVHSIGVKHLYVAGNPVLGSSWHKHHLDYSVPLELVSEALDFCLATGDQLS